MKLLARISDPIREFGILSGTVYATHRILGKISPNMGLFFYDYTLQPITDKSLLPERFAKSYVIRELPQGDPLIARMPIQAKNLALRYHQDVTCIGIFKKEELVSYIWLAFKTYDEDEIRATLVLHPSDQASFDFSFFIFPEHRLGLTFAATWNAVNRYLYKKGVRYTYSRITRTKINSANSHKRLGAEFIGWSLTLKLWKLELTFSSLKPRIWMSTSLSKRVRFDLTPKTAQAKT